MSSKQLKKKNSKNPEEKMKIKTEKLDNKIYTMEHYVGDPVDLIKQVFATLNPKTIKNLAPESLKECKIEEIQELCFNELLGISSKRLKSIINATKCPTDTESSDDDIQNIDEHISLEEISSDSDNGKKSDKNKNGKVNPEAKTKGTNNKEMSVLELLELQARARAIRSQLALEPIAKIEVDSDDSNDDESDERTKKSKNTTVHHNENHNKNSHNKSSGQSSSVSIKVGEKRKEENNVIVNGSGNNATTTNENRPKKIKLKRNFRKRSIDQNPENTINNSNQLNITTDKEELPLSEKNIEKINDKSPKIDTDRSPSPDVLQILPNYETLCISDSDDDDRKEKQKNTTKSTENHKNVLEKPVKTSHDNNEENGISKETCEDDKREDFEDGEIIDNGVNVVENSNDKDNDSKKINDNKNNDDRNDKSEDKNDDNNDHKCQTENAIKSSEENILATSKIVEITNEIDLNDSDHHNDDDIISLGDDDDLDYEMHDSVEDIKENSKLIPKIERQSPEKNDDVNEPTDFIELHDSGDENESTVNQGQSWNTRWLQSKKVSKIMAESKLGNRVRDKRKKTKKAQLELQQQQQQQQQDLELAREKLESNSKNSYVSNFEDGSLQQYKEIIDRVTNTE